MGNQRNIKDMRSQLRNVIQEYKDELVTQEVGQTIAKNLNEVINQRLTALEKHVRATLEEIDNRSKDLQSFVLRQNLPAVEVPAPTKQDDAEPGPATLTPTA